MNVPPHLLRHLMGLRAVVRLRTGVLRAPKAFDFPAVGGPLVVGALGGSGTRAVVDILREAGVFLGGTLDPLTNDSLAMRAFLYRWFRPLVQAHETGKPFSKRAFDWLETAVSLHLEAMPEATQLWGWKNPRSMWLIPFFQERFPSMRFLHLVRDPRDMALSRNRFLLRTQGRFLLSSGSGSDPVADQLQLWTRGNTLARDAGSQLQTGHYMVLRYEELCLEPAQSAARILSFLGIRSSSDLIERCTALVQPAKGLGRGQTLTADGRALPTSTRRLMEELGYDSGGDTSKEAPFRTG